mgnify:CR=1 FL=1
MKKVAIHNLGCKVNSYEAESMEQMLRAAGYSIVPFDENVPADVYIINTCSVTNIADRKSRQTASQGKEDERMPLSLPQAVMYSPTVKAYRKMKR